MDLQLLKRIEEQMALIELRGARPSDLMPRDSTARRPRTESEHDYICIWTHTCIRYASRPADMQRLSPGN